MANIFWLQLRALIWKNWIVLLQHPFVRFLHPFKVNLLKEALDIHRALLLAAHCVRYLPCHGPAIPQ